MSTAPRTDTVQEKPCRGYAQYRSMWLLVSQSWSPLKNQHTHKLPHKAIKGLKGYLVLLWVTHKYHLSLGRCSDGS